MTIGNSSEKADTVFRQSRRDLTHRTIGGFLWMFSGFGVQAVLEVLIVAVLARLLAPRDFGVVAAALVIIKFSLVFSHLGVAPAIVQCPKLEKEHIRAGFALSCILSLLLAGVVFLLAPYTAAFFKMEKLASVLRLLSLSFPIQGISVVAESLLQRNMNFRWLAGVRAMSYAVGYGVAGIGLAFAGFGMWALVWAHLGQMAAKSIFALTLQPHPKFPVFQQKVFIDLLSFGGGFTIGRIANSIAGQGGNFVIGRWLGAEALGIFGRADRLMALLPALFGMALDKALFPAMAKVQDQQERLKTAYRRGIAFISLIVLPASTAMYVLSHEIIMFLYGPAWLDAVIPLQVLTFGMLFRTNSSMSDSLARATGAVYRRAWRQCLYAGFMLGGALFGQFWGLPGVAGGILLAVMLNYILMTHLSLKIASMTWREFFIAHFPALQLAIIVWSEVFLLTAALRDLDPPAIIVLFTAMLVAGMSIVVMLFLAPTFFLGKENLEIIQKLLSFLPNKYQLFIKAKNY